MNGDRKFLAGFAVFLIVLASSYIGAITFVPLPTGAKEYANTVLGFLLGSVIGAVMKHFYDSSNASQANQAAIRAIAAQIPAPPNPPAPVAAEPKPNEVPQ